LTNLKQRAITGLLFAAIVISCVWANQWTLLLLLASILVLGILEFYNLMVQAGFSPQKRFGLGISLLFCAMVYFVVHGHVSASDFTVFLPLLFSVFILELYRKRDHPFINIAITFTGIIYLAVPISLLMIMAFLPHHGEEAYHGGLLLGCILHIWANDTGAYFIGTRFGKNRLFERISPKKSWEGFWGGVALSLVAAWVNQHLFGQIEMIHWVAIALIMSVVGTLGDLVESLLKRSIDIKDSGSFFPGHGGILDRFDAWLIAFPFVCCYLWLVGHFS
jgi:phosphatidate cytidylyltransferase